MDVEWSKALPEPLVLLREIFFPQGLTGAYDVLNRDDLCQHLLVKVDWDERSEPLRLI